jgi:molybdopterin/thiamine biosynthesis adenylyltransferase
MIRNYTMVGAGGTGAALFFPLLRYLENFYSFRDDDFRLTVIDGKDVAATKLHRQMFSGDQVGNPKATALIQQYKADPDVVIAIPRYLGPDDMDGIQDGDVILIAADNFPVRARIEARGLELNNITVINGGNEDTDGSLQIWVRRDGDNVSAPMSQGHPEILRDDDADPVGKTCQEVAEMPGGEQTIMANMMSATAMLNGLRLVHKWETDRLGPSDSDSFPEEVFFDLNTFAMRSAMRPVL